tara:strand:- start:887 stop:1657 length:771 start_codon:yes stop_codon:yes gene_type:complete
MSIIDNNIKYTEQLYNILLYSQNKCSTYLSENIIVKELLFISFIIFFFDNLFCFIFGKKARWFQLHCLINIIVTIDIIPDIIDFIINPNEGYKLLTSNTSSYYILIVHLYHIFMFKNLNLIDYFHHILFIGFGVVPTLYFVNSNQIYLGYIVCNGIPGIIEYGSLTLVKHNLLSIYNQKKLNTILYIFLRLPMCIFGSTMNLVAYKNGLISDTLVVTLYMNCLLYFNGCFFTILTCDSFFKLKYSDQIINIKNKRD